MERANRIPGGILEMTRSLLNSPVVEAENTHIPQVDILEDILVAEFRVLAESAGLSIPSQPMWPQNRSLAVGLSHDVDRVSRSYQAVAHSTQLALRGQLNHSKRLLQDRVANRDDFWGFPAIQALEREADVRSTWFWLNEGKPLKRLLPTHWKTYYGRYKWSDHRVRNMIEELTAQGHEMGVHNSIASLTDTERNAADRERLSKLSNSTVVGCRQHYLSIRIPQTWNVFQDAGFLYDSSLGFADSWGFRFRTASPFKPVVNGTYLSFMDKSVAGSSDADAQVNAAFNAVARVRGCMVVNWHSNVFGSYYSGYADTYKAVLREAKSRDAWIAPLGQIANWWLNRSRHLICGDDGGGIIGDTSQDRPSSFKAGIG